MVTLKKELEKNNLIKRLRELFYHQAHVAPISVRNINQYQKGFQLVAGTIIG